MTRYTTNKTPTVVAKTINEKTIVAHMHGILEAGLFDLIDPVNRTPQSERTPNEIGSQHQRILLQRSGNTEIPLLLKKP